MELKVIDMLPGSRKTTSMKQFISQMNKSQETRHFIYLTPYNKGMEEIGYEIMYNSWTPTQRLAMSTGEYQPKDFGNPIPKVPDDVFTKTSSMMRSLKGEQNIVCSHELFRLVSQRKKFWELIQNKHYTLVIDEEIPLEKDYKFEGCYPTDLKFYLTRSIDGEPPVVSVDEHGVMHWDSTKRDAGKGVFRRLKKDIRTGCLSYRDGWVRWRIPIEKFEVFDDVYLMTYRFEFSQFKLLWTGDWSYWHFEGDELVEGKWQIPQERVDNIRRRVKIADEKCYPQIGKKGHFTYSLAWYQEATPYDISMLVDRMQYYIKYGAAGKRLDRTKIIWTVFKAYKESIEKWDLGPNHFRPLRGDVESFIPLNMRASNDYLDRNVVFYLVDRYPGGNSPIPKDEWALSELLQFLFRTCLRLPDSEEVVYAYIPSERMRRLLERWLDNPV